MREASIILPLRDNNGARVDAAHLALQRELAESFGGFTYAPVNGAWLDSGRLYRDRSREYRVAADWNDGLRQRLRLLAESAGRKARQLAVYVRDDRGAVSIVPTA